MEERPIETGSRKFIAGEVLLILVVFFLFAGGMAPDVNEAHYLSKAKHYWNPEWCQGDHFLESDDAHTVFFWAFGWVTLFLSLPATAWLGRVLTWFLLAWSWWRLSDGVTPQRWMPVLTASVFVCLMHYGHFAGEWVVGGVEAKGISFALMLFSLGYVVRDRWTPAWLLAGISTSFHVLVGGWSLCALLAASVAVRGLGRTCRSWWAVLGAALLTLPGLWPALQLAADTTSAEVTLANEIYVFHRLSHHLVFHRIFYSHGGLYALRFGVLLMGWGWLVWHLRRQPRICTLQKVVSAAVAIASVGIVIDQATLWDRVLAAAWLRFYWFRLSDVMVPLGIALGTGYWWRVERSQRPVLARGLLIVLIVFSGVGLSVRALRRRVERRPAAVVQANPILRDQTELARDRYLDWVRVCQWIRVNTRRDASFLTPLRQQTFKWYAHRSEVATRKDVPQNARSLVQWQQRMQDLRPLQLNGVDQLNSADQGEVQKLLAVCRSYGVTHVLIDRLDSEGSLPLTRVYPRGPEQNRHFSVFRLRSQTIVLPAPRTRSSR